MSSPDAITSATAPQEAGASTEAQNTAGASAGASQAGGELSGSTQLHSMDELKEKSPKLYNMMMQGIAMNIVNEMKDHQEKIKEMMRKAEQEAQGR